MLFRTSHVRHVFTPLRRMICISKAIVITIMLPYFMPATAPMLPGMTSTGCFSESRSILIAEQCSEFLHGTA